MPNQTLPEQFPTDYAWAFLGDSPAAMALPQTQVAKELSTRTGRPWRRSTVVHAMRREGLYRKHPRSAQESVVTAAPVTADVVAVPVDETARIAAERAEWRVEQEQVLSVMRAEKRYLGDLAKNESRVRNFLDQLRGEIHALPPPPAWTPSPEQPRERTPHALLLQWNDFHAGKHVREKDVGEGFHYEKNELEQSVDRWLAAIEDIVDIHRHAYPVDICYLTILGDMVENSLMRASQRLRIDHAIGTVGRQTVYVGDKIAEVVRWLSGRFTKVVVLAVSGNHGRVGKFGEDEVVDNFDWLAYHIAELLCKDIPNVAFRISDPPTMLVKIGEKLLLLQHGNAIRSWGESPAGAIKRGIRKDAFVTQQFFDIALGAHFHQSLSFQAGGKTRVFFGGNWDGGDSFCVHDLKEACEPSQNAFILHPRRGIVAQYEIALREVERSPMQPIDVNVVIDNLASAGVAY